MTPSRDSRAYPLETDPVTSAEYHANPSAPRAGDRWQERQSRHATMTRWAALLQVAPPSLLHLEATLSGGGVA